MSKDLFHCYRKYQHVYGAFSLPEICIKFASHTATKTGGVPFPTPIPNDSSKAAQAGTSTAQALGKPTTAATSAAAIAVTGPLPPRPLL